MPKTLFVTDAFGGSSFTGAVYAFSWVKGTSLGQVAAPPEGFLEVQGGCSDNNGNVYFANTEMSTIDEYNHSGTFITSIADPGQFPVGCSYDKSTAVLMAVSKPSSTRAASRGGHLNLQRRRVAKGAFLHLRMGTVSYFQVGLERGDERLLGIRLLD